MNNSETLGLFEREILTPATVASRLQATFDREIGSIWVEGEISDLSTPYSGHAYFQLKEAIRGQEVRLKAVMWKGRRAYAGGVLTEGMLVLARGRLAVYAPRGEVQLTVDYLEPRGEGALRLAFEKLKVSLSGEGLFAEERKRPLPFWPAKVAIISSASGAAVHDFVQTARSLRPGAHISLYPVRVQGEGSVAEIVRAISDINLLGGFDLLVLTRGGGSLADLWSFNTEEVVRAVASSRLPIVVAIGHSTDQSLAELAADAQAITPTAAAKIIFRDQFALREHVAEQNIRLLRAATRTITQRQDRLNGAHLHLKRSVANQLERRRRDCLELTRRLERFEDRLGLAGQNLDHLFTRLNRAISGHLEHLSGRLKESSNMLGLLSPAPQLIANKRELADMEQRIRFAITNRIAREGQNLSALTSRLEALSPRSILKRGYALVTTGAKGQLINTTQGLTVGQELTVRLRHGQFKSIVKSISESPKQSQPDEKDIN